MFRGAAGLARAEGPYPACGLAWRKGPFRSRNAAISAIRFFSRNRAWPARWALRWNSSRSGTSSTHSWSKMRWLVSPTRRLSNGSSEVYSRRSISIREGRFSSDGHKPHATGRRNSGFASGNSVLRVKIFLCTFVSDPIHTEQHTSLTSRGRPLYMAAVPSARMKVIFASHYIASTPNIWMKVILHYIARIRIRCK